mgnify:CR=1 FL=1
MIYNFIGQPHAGKTTLANHLKNVLENAYREKDPETTKRCIIVDGDVLRNILNNKDFSEEGRRYNINQAYNIAKFLDADYNFDVIIAVVSPFLDLRERLKKETDVVEIYVHTSNIRGRENFHVPYFEKPERNFIDIDTTDVDELTTMNELLTKIEEICQLN